MKIIPPGIQEGELGLNPRQFSGLLSFTNPDSEDFTFIWNGQPYHFEAGATAPFVIMDASMAEMNEIRKRAALKLARRIFGKSDRYKALEKKMTDRPGAVWFYDEEQELKPYIEQCLKQLPVKASEVGEKAVHTIQTKEKVRVIEDHTESLVARALNS